MAKTFICFVVMIIFSPAFQGSLAEPLGLCFILGRLAKRSLSLICIAVKPSSIPPIFLLVQWLLCFKRKMGTFCVQKRDCHFELFQRLNHQYAWSLLYQHFSRQLCLHALLRQAVTIPYHVFSVLVPLYTYCTHCLHILRSVVLVLGLCLFFLLLLLFSPISVHTAVVIPLRPANWLVSP